MWWHAAFPRDGVTEKSSLSCLQYSVGDEVCMRVSSVTDPDNIFVVDCTNTDTFTVLSQQMQEFYNGKMLVPSAVLFATRPTSLTR